MNALICIGWK